MVETRDAKSHRLVARLMKRCGIDDAALPSDEAWQQFLRSTTDLLDDLEQDRYLLERSLEASSQEMMTLNEHLRESADRLAAEREELREANSLLAATLESTEDGILVVAADGRITNFNRRFVEMWNLPSEVVERRDRVEFGDHVAHQLCDPDGFRRALETLYSDPSLVRHDVLEFADGRVYERHSRPQQIGNEIVGRVLYFRDVTVSRQLQADLDAAAIELQRVLDCAPDALSTLDVATFEMVLLNRPDLLGHDPDGITGMLSLEDLVHPDDVASVADWWFNEVIAAGAIGSFDHEMRLRRADGLYVWVSVRLSPLTFDDGGSPATLLAAITDVNDRHRAEHARAESERHLRAVLDASPDVVGFLDLADLRLEFVNASEFLGYPTDQLRNLTNDAPRDFVHPDDVENLAQLLAGDFDARSNQGVEFRCRHANGGWEWIRIRHSVAAYDTIGEPTRILLTLTMIGDEIHAREQHDRLRTQLEQSQRLQAVGQLAGGVAHDFNNLLSAILGFAELLEDAVPDEQARSDLREVQDAAQRGAELTRRLLMFSRGEAAVGTACNIGEVLTGMHGLLSRTIGEYIELGLQVEDAPSVVADATGIEQILMNLVVNARDSIDGPGRIDVTTEVRCIGDCEGSTVVHEDLAAGSYVVLTVQDSGSGMDAATVQRAFEPFFTTKASARGTGLGLATVYGIVRRFAGHVEIESEVGLGTTVRVYLPVASATPTPPVPDPSVVDDVSTLHSIEARILLVEDESAVRSATRRILERAGYEVTEAPNGSVALAAAAGAHFDLLLTDVVMPGEMSGQATADAIREIGACDHVLYMSGYAPEAVANQGFIEPGVPLLEKPVSADHLLATIERVLVSEPMRR